MDSFLLATAHEAGAAAAEHGAAGAEHASEGGIQLGLHWTANLGPGVVHVDTILYSLIVMIILLVVFAALGKTVNSVPSQESGPVGTVVEGIVEFCQKIIRDFIGHNTAKYLWLIGSIFVFVLFANWLAQLPWKLWEATVGAPLQSALNAVLPEALHAPHPIVYEAPTADINLTLALGLVSLVAYWVYGISKNGFGGFIGHHWFAAPVALFPLRMMEDITRPVSLALRLFANMTAGHVVGLVLLMLVPFLIPAVMLPLELFIGAVQAFIFATLTASYIGAAEADHH